MPNNFGESWDNGVIFWSVLISFISYSSLEDGNNFDDDNHYDYHGDWWLCKPGFDLMRSNGRLPWRGRWGGKQVDGWQRHHGNLNSSWLSLLSRSSWSWQQSYKWMADHGITVTSSWWSWSSSGPTTELRSPESSNIIAPTIEYHKSPDEKRM